MPEQDFELYLSLLSRFLRLKPAQRDEIADELRDHLEERLEELAARGLSRGEAIRAALDEFGDAAELANHFTHVAHIRKRRLIMRFTFGSVAALAAALLVTTAFWPESPQAPSPRNAVAQGFGGQKKPAGKSVATEDEDKAAVEKMLAKQLGKIELMDMPLSEALEFLSDRIGVDILLNRAVLAEEGVALDQPIQLVVKRANLSARAVMDLILEPLKLSYTVRDGLIMVTTIADANQIQVYNVRDLLRQPAMNAGTGPAGMMGGMGGMGGGMMGGGGGGFFCFAPERREESGHERLREFDGPESALNPHDGPGLGVADDLGIGERADERQLAQGFGGGGRGAAGPAAPGAGGAAGGMGGMMPGMGGGGGGMGGVTYQTNALAQVIATTIDPGSWDANGGNGSIVQYHELLVVKNSQTVHGKIKALLEMMRASAREIPGDDGGAAPVGGGPAGEIPGAAPELGPPGK